MFKKLLICLMCAVYCMFLVGCNEFEGYVLEQAEIKAIHIPETSSENIYYTAYKDAVEKSNSLPYQKYIVSTEIRNTPVSGEALFKNSGEHYKYLISLTVQSQELRAWSDGQSIFVQTPLGVVRAEASQDGIVTSSQIELFSTSVVDSIMAETENGETKYTLTTVNTEVVATEVLKDIITQYSGYFLTSDINTQFGSGVYEVYVNQDGYAYKFISVVAVDGIEYTFTVELVDIGRDMDFELPVAENYIGQDFLDNNDAGMNFTMDGAVEALGPFIETINNLSWE